MYVFYLFTWFSFQKWLIARKCKVKTMLRFGAISPFENHIYNWIDI